MMNYKIGNKKRIYLYLMGKVAFQFDFFALKFNIYLVACYGYKIKKKK